MRNIIQTNQLSKSYKDFKAVDQVSLSINKGEIYGFIGLNGAGKTTTIRMILGMIRPTEGSCYISGKKVSFNTYSIWSKVGYMVETPYAYPELTVAENLHIFRRLRLISDPNTVTRVIDLLKLTPYAQKKAKNLSLGNAQRLGIAKALLHNPEILILDEPVNGLDPAGIVEIRELLQDLSFNKDVTIFISSHLLSEVAKIATKIGIIHAGQLIQEVETTKLTQLLNRRLLLDAREKNLAVSTLTTAGYSPLLNQDGLIETTNNTAILNPDEIASLLVNKGCPPTRLIVDEENLESYFLRLIGKNGG
ncbi:Bacitracin transport ATP-binding protein BcrA [Neobacillus rhizosphaerae]|uniref:Bacitracin transport ATP-binding protein BcrA n=1 Tax=Neobacillus rhizosphaerae TaxID=2880965 RepID=A0ABM9ET19_9BACI|nr:ABC transporter ATP-binding protein [Neobacillus rhizosphaerae]CAH2715338.1 Bacitracin transport ATP-binding protein BcrA [Neobacillus rhizosphaerae]